MGFVYVLQLKCGKYYVGYTSRENGERIQEHFGSIGAEWTKIFLPINVLETIPGDLETENQVTLDTMKKYGWWNVRGGKWTKVVMTEPPEELGMSGPEKVPSVNSCPRCGRISHKLDKCYAKTDIYGRVIPILCSRCGRNSHVTSDCYARSHLNGTSLVGPAARTCPEVVGPAARTCPEVVGPAARTCPEVVGPTNKILETPDDTYILVPAKVEQPFSDFVVPEEIPREVVPEVQPFISRIYNSFMSVFS